MPKKQALARQPDPEAELPVTRHCLHATLGGAVERREIPDARNTRKNWGSRAWRQHKGRGWWAHKQVNLKRKDWSLSSSEIRGKE